MECPHCHRPLTEGEKCEECYSHTCPVCHKPVYRDESWCRGNDGRMKHHRCRYGRPVARPAYMSKTRTDTP